MKNGLKSGKWKAMNKNTGYQYTDIYKEGKFVSGKSIDNKGTERRYNVLESRPLPQKGIDDFYKFIAANFEKKKKR